MGTNYYLRSRAPRQVYDSFHLVKLSAGRKPLFQSCKCYMEAPYLALQSSGPEVPEYWSVGDVAMLLRSGSMALVDEEDIEYEGEDAVSKLGELAGWCPGGRSNFGTLLDYFDEEGNEFTNTEFF